MGAAEMAERFPSNPVCKTRLPRRGPRKGKAIIAPEKIRISTLCRSLRHPWVGSKGHRDSRSAETCGCGSLQSRSAELEELAQTLKTQRETV